MKQLNRDLTLLPLDKFLFYDTILLSMKYMHTQIRFY